MGFRVCPTETETHPPQTETCFIRQFVPLFWLCLLVRNKPKHVHSKPKHVLSFSFYHTFALAPETETHPPQTETCFIIQLLPIIWLCVLVRSKPKHVHSKPKHVLSYSFYHTFALAPETETHPPQTEACFIIQFLPIIWLCVLVRSKPKHVHSKPKHVLSYSFYHTSALAPETETHPPQTETIYQVLFSVFVGMHAFLCVSIHLYELAVSIILVLTSSSCWLKPFCIFLVWRYVENALPLCKPYGHMPAAAVWRFAVMTLAVLE